MPWRDWDGELADLATLAQRQIFFVGGAPRSGTTWLQQILHAHPDVSCMGEGLLQRHLATPLDGMMTAWGTALAEKNARLFGHTGGYPLPPEGEADLLVRVAILRALSRQDKAATARAIGEKTPENVFQFERLRRLFPRARFIGIARDPRDLLASAWHFFHKSAPGEDAHAAKMDFVRKALPSIDLGAKVMLSLAERYPADCLLLTYESLRADTAGGMAALYRFLDVPHPPALVADCMARTSFAAMTGGRPAGVEEQGAFLRKGVVGDWTATLPPEAGALILRELGWMYPRLGLA